MARHHVLAQEQRGIALDCILLRSAGRVIMDPPRAGTMVSLVGSYPRRRLLPLDSCGSEGAW